MIPPLAAAVLTCVAVAILLFVWLAFAAVAPEGPPVAFMSGGRRLGPGLGRAPGTPPTGAPARPRKPVSRERAIARMFTEKMERRVWRWLKRLGVQPHDRRDLAQDVFREVCETLPNYDPNRSSPSRWVNSITVHVASHHLEREEVRALGGRSPAPPDPAPPPDVGQQMDEARLPAAVIDLLATLEPELRRVLVAHDVDEIPMAEIATAEGIPLSTAYKWRARALARLREEPEGNPAAAAAWRAAREALK